MGDTSNGCGNRHGSIQAAREEDEKFIPVVVKRTDEGRRHPDDTLEHTVKDGLEQVQRGGVSLLLSAVAGGMILGFTVMAVGIATKASAPYDSPIITRVFTALVYPLGFVICVLSGAQLFTEHTAIAVYPVLDKKASLSQLLRLWLIVIAGNLLGAIIIAVLLSIAEPVIDAREGYAKMGHHLVSYSLSPLLASRPARRLADGAGSLACGRNLRHYRPDAFRLHRHVS